MTDVISILKECEAMLEGHFLLSSGRHSDKYFQCARLLQYPDKAAAVLSLVADRIRADEKSGLLKIDSIAGPAMGGIIVAYELGRLLQKPAFFTERDDAGVMILRRGFTVRHGENILIAEDVVTTGKSSQECAAALEKAGAKVAALACIVDRRSDAGNGKAAALPFYAACKVTAANWAAGECNLCNKGLPFVKPGSRKLV
ncbi:orotate phosphoribosyltransferase [Spirochaetia bacterium]|nr:orotate phosphoribosyltransferase [Spirochaetia bacterium]